MQHTDIVYFDDSFHGDGWHEAEFYETDSSRVYYRWMASGGPCSLALMASNSTYSFVECDILSVVNNEVFEHLTVKVDGKPIVWAVTGDQDRGYSLKFLIPPKYDSATCDVTFNVLKVFNGGGGDMRALSFAYRKVVVTNASYSSIIELLEVVD